METVEMVKAWRLRYVTKAFSWVKTYASGGIFFGIGSYTASNTEDVWLLSNGTPKRKAKDVSQIVPTLIKQDAIVAPLTDHSAKPEEMQDRIERLLTGPYLELFARRRRPGWVCIGNELDGLDVRDSLARLAKDEPLPIAAQAEETQAGLFLEAA
jgi:N6-adenosine-specific RNA methylase IME4